MPEMNQRIPKRVLSGLLSSISAGVVPRMGAPYIAIGRNEEIEALLRKTKEGDTQAREELIAGNLRLVLSVIQKFAGRGENVFLRPHSLQLFSFGERAPVYSV